jgi:hypothetical protein
LPVRPSNESSGVARTTFDQRIMGYLGDGPIYPDAGIEHRAMALRLDG